MLMGREVALESFKKTLTEKLYPIAKKRASQIAGCSEPDQDLEPREWYAWAERSFPAFKKTIQELVLTGGFDYEDTIDCLIPEAVDEANNLLGREPPLLDTAWPAWTKEWDRVYHAAMNSLSYEFGLRCLTFQDLATEDDLGPTGPPQYTSQWEATVHQMTQADEYSMDGSGRKKGLNGRVMPCNAAV